MTDAPRLHTLEVGAEGDGPWVVFLHGLFGQGRNFTQIAKALTPGLRSVLVDLPNHGRSAWTDDAGYDAVAEVVADWLGERFDHPVHLVGHSMGGKVAMVVALRHPDLLDRLVVADISPAPSEGADEFEHLLGSLARLDLPALHRRADADAALAADVLDERVRGFLLQNLRSGPEGFSWQANLDLLRAQLPRIGGFPDALLHPEDHPDHPVFDHPTLWIAGELSSYVRPEHEATMRALFPRTRLVTLKGAGHWVHSEQPEAFTSALRVFLGG